MSDVFDGYERQYCELSAIYRRNAHRPAYSMEEVEMSNAGTSGDQWISRKKETDGYKPALLDVLGQVMINIDPETPVSTLRNCIISSKADVSFSKEELRKVEVKLRRAFVEFIQRLRVFDS